MLIDNRVFEPYTIELNSPLTDEQWDILDDVDFDHTEHIWFHTKHGKEVHFYKNAIPIAWIKMFLEENYPIESPYGTKAYFHDFMKRMIKKWEKENDNKHTI